MALPTHSQKGQVNKETECNICSGFIMNEIEQLLYYLLTCPCKDVNKNTLWKRSITLDLEYQNTKKII